MSTKCFRTHKWTDKQTKRTSGQTNETGFIIDKAILVSNTKQMVLGNHNWQNQAMCEKLAADCPALCCFTFCCPEQNYFNVCRCIFLLISTESLSFACSLDLSGLSKCAAGTRKVLGFLWVRGWNKLDAVAVPSKYSQLFEWRRWSQHRYCIFLPRRGEMKINFWYLTWLIQDAPPRGIASLCTTRYFDLLSWKWLLQIAPRGVAAELCWPTFWTNFYAQTWTNRCIDRILYPFARKNCRINLWSQQCAAIMFLTQKKTTTLNFLLARLEYRVWPWWFTIFSFGAWFCIPCSRPQV